MSRFIQLLGLSLATLACFCQSGFAQGDALVERYGEGVHQFYAGHYAEADRLLSEVINSGSQDPRAHYFRGLVREAMGGGGEFDFETGARLEAEGKRVVAVGAALQRIQGHVRSKIEKARRDARIQYRQQQAMMEEARRNAMPAPPPELTQPGDATPGPGDADESDPFAEGMQSPEKTVDPEVDATVDPFMDDPSQPGVPAADAPSPVAPEGDMFDSPATPDAGNGSGGDIFGGEGTGDAANPFGDAPATGGDAGDASSNPFEGF